MPTPQFPAVGDDATLEDLRDAYISISRYLTYLLSALDTLNISRLDAKVVEANTITADKLNVSQLSAIAADLGTVTAGTIIGALIKTAASGSRIELSSVSDFLAAYQTDTNFFKIDPGLTGPGLIWNDGTGQMTMFLATLFGLTTFLMSCSKTLRIESSAEDVEISAGAGKFVKFDSFAAMYNNASGVDLQSALNAKQDTISGYSGTVTVVTGVDFTAETTTTSDITISNGIITNVT